jgi:hypothetical protein
MALGLRRAPGDAAGCRCPRRRDAAALEHTLRAAGPRRGVQPGHQATVAVDATGLAPGAGSPFFVARANDRGDGFPWRHRLKWTMAGDVDRQPVVAPAARRGPANDCATLRPLGEAAHPRVPTALGLADAEFGSGRNQPHGRQALQAQRIIPARRGGAHWHMQGVRAQRRQAWAAHRDGRRALLESLISAVTRQLSARAPGRSLVTQWLQALRLGIADTLDRLWWCTLLGIRRMSTEPHEL